MAALSWNFLILAASLGGEVGAKSLTTLDPNKAFEKGRCSWRTPQWCAFVAGVLSQTRYARSDVRAGGNGRFGRANWLWHTIGEGVLTYQKRNVFGFSTDFAEDTTKSSWGIEFTWQDDIYAADNNEFSGLSEIDQFALTISVDRPTFINFLNANRTFFFNSQLFVSYLSGYTSGTVQPGPYTFLWSLTGNTGYFQDRLLVGATGVYDFRTNSGAFLPSVQYRFTENFSATFGAAWFSGRWEPRARGINQFSATSDTVIDDRTFALRGLAPARDLDHLFFRLRYTF